MHDFLVRAALRGARPAHLPTFRAYKRSAPMMALMRERNVARFVVAPAGFGKTTLLLEYAESIFSFRHVFWIRCDQSGFLSCLDRGGMAREIMAVEHEAPLVVFDDVPQLDSARASGFLETIEGLLAAGCEVIVSMPPTADSFECIVDRVLVSASDLMVSGEEVVSASIASSYCTPLDPESIPLPERVPGLIWSQSDQAKVFLSRIVREGLSSEFLLPMFCMLVLGSGRLGDVGSIACVKRDTMSVLASSYLFLGIDEVADTFATAPFGIEAVIDVFRGRTRVLAERSSLRAEGKLVEALANRLISADDLARSCDLMRLAAMPASRAGWLGARDSSFLNGCCLVAASALFGSLASRDRSGALCAFDALRLWLLDDKVGAVVAAQRVLAAGDANVCAAGVCDQLTASACLIACSASNARVAALAKASELACQVRDLLACADAFPDGRDEVEDRLGALTVVIALNDDRRRAPAEWIAAFAGDAASASALLAGAEVLSAVSLRQSSDVEQVAAALASEVARAFARSGELTLPQALAALAFDRARSGGPLELPALDDALIQTARAYERMLASQRVHAERCRRSRAHEVLCRRAASRDPLKRTAQPERPVRPPVLTVNLFGGMDVRIGGVEVDRKRLHRRKLRLLLALLVLRRGNEIPRTYLAEQLYPDSTRETGLANISSLKSKLAGILKAPDGTCPYLVERQGSFGLDASLLRSDVIEIDAVCDALSRRAPSQGDWSSLLARANDAFADDLLPGESGIPAIEPMRRKYRTKLVDAFVTASDILVRSHRPHDGLLYARAAYDRDSRREDVCYALMQAQYACLQTASAIDTYLRCSRYLSEELGMDPSPKTDALYRRILDREEIADSHANALFSPACCDRVARL